MCVFHYEYSFWVLAGQLVNSQGFGFGFFFAYGGQNQLPVTTECNCAVGETVPMGRLLSSARALPFYELQELEEANEK